MSTESTSPDDRIQALDADIKRQLTRLPKPTIFPSPPASPKRPLFWVRCLIGIILICGTLELVSLVGQLFMPPETLVWVSLDGGKAQLWRSPEDYEAATGNVWNPANLQHVDYVSASRQDTVEKIILLVLGLVLALAASRQVKAADKRLASQP